MKNMRFKVGDRVRIKSLDWYNMHCDDAGNVDCGCEIFEKEMKPYLGKVFTIHRIVDNSKYEMEEAFDFFLFTDEMIEGLAEDETKPKFKVGDKIRLKSTLLNDIFGVIGYESDSYRITNISNGLTYFMSYPIEHCYELVEEEVGLVDNFSSRWVNEFNLPEGYIFKDQAGNEIHALKIVLEKANTLKTQNNMETETHRGYYTTDVETTNESKKVAWFTFEDNDFADKVELALSNRELIQEDGKWFVVKKKKEYPKTYEECLSVLEIYNGLPDVEIYNAKPSECKLFESLIRLKRCRDTYWKLYGEEMGLGESWEPDWEDDNTKYSIYTIKGVLMKAISCYDGAILTFPTEEMRDAFYENFKELIESVKELL